MDDFFKDKYFQALNSQLTDLKQGITDLQREVAEIKSKVVYMYGFAAAIGFVISFVSNYVYNILSRHN